MTISLELVNLDSIQINGNATTMSYVALRIKSNSQSAFRFGNEWKSQIWLLLKNRTKSGANVHIGQVLYINSSSVYTLASTTTNDTENSYAGKNLVIKLPPYYYGTVTNTWPSTDPAVQLKAIFWTKETTNVALTNTIKNGRATIVRIEVPERIYGAESSTSPIQANWINYISFGGSAFGNPVETWAKFINKPGSTSTGKVTYEYHANAPYCSTRGSCIEAAPTLSGVFIKYATVLPT